MVDIRESMKAVASVISGHIKEAFSVILPRIERLEKAVEPETIQPMIVEAVTAAVAQLPAPENGKSVTVEDVQPMIVEAVTAAVAQLPAPENGKSVTVEDVQPMIVEAVTAAVAQLPAPGNGKSVTVEDVQPMIVEAVTAAVAQLPTPENGKSVTVEDVQPMIVEAVTAAVAQLPTPENGKDALTIEILPTIDIQRNYTRGQFAVHRGGLWRAFQGTTGMHGWECVVNGLTDLEIGISEDFRTLSVVAEMADGRKTEKSVQIPVVIDQGVYNPEKSYGIGDGVTYGGSYWIAIKNEQAGAPGQQLEEGSGWRLAVRKGRDAKNIPPRPPTKSGPVKLGE